MTYYGRYSKQYQIHSLIVLCGVLLFSLGCSEQADFRSNLVVVHQMELKMETTFDTDYQTRPIAEILEAAFGTPDNPYLPPIEGIDEVLDIDKIRMAAGPYGSDESGNPRGLYRQHCVHCHGISGDGAGPTAAFLNPYPRDYRMGKFKFKSTPTGIRPTHADLKKTLLKGITGTSMPSFELLDEDEVDALTHYVKYLAIRGEVERQLILDEDQIGGLYTVPVRPWMQLTEDEAEELSNMSEDEIEEEIETLKEDSQYLKSKENLEGLLLMVLEGWQEAENQVLEIDAKPDLELEASISKGRELFMSATAGCSTCHGPSGIGDGQTGTDYLDDWTKEYYNPEKPDLLPEFLALGALEPRQLRPRNLRQGVFRGGRRPIDIFWRIRNGIEGSGMPAAKEEALSDEDLWHLVDFVRYGLPYDSLSRPQVHKPENTRERS